MPIMSNTTKILELYALVSSSGKITLAERLVIGTAFLDNVLSEEELTLIDRMYYFVRRGKLTIVTD